MAKQLHMKFPNERVKSILRRYLSKEIKIGYILEILSNKRSRFFELSIFLGFSLNSVARKPQVKTMYRFSLLILAVFIEIEFVILPAPIFTHKNVGLMNQAPAEYV